MKRITLILLLLFVYSCADREVQLAETTLNEITEILDVSPAYLFYDEKTQDVEFNRKNLIGTTNWIINIDKRLTLEQVFPHLIYLQEKRNKAGMHKNVNAKNYLTCFNQNTKGVSFIDFTDTQLSIKTNTDTLPNSTRSVFYCSIKFNHLDNIEILTNTLGHAVNETYSSLSSALDELHTLSQNDRTTVSLFFNNQLSYQDYITIKSSIISLASNNLEILNKEIIYK